MKAYILVEGARTEMKLYPAWLGSFVPNFKRYTSVDQASEDGHGYFIFSGGGQPRLFDVALPASISDVKTHGGYDELVLIFDSEGTPPAQIYARAEEVIKKEKLPDSVRARIIVQHPCIETWLLGNRNIYTGAPQCPVYRSYLNHYHTGRNDPEGLLKPPGNQHQNLAKFHLEYLKKALQEKEEKYGKVFVGPTRKDHYLAAILERCRDGDLANVKPFLQLLEDARRACGLAA